MKKEEVKRKRRRFLFKRFLMGKYNLFEEEAEKIIDGVDIIIRGRQRR